MSSSASPISRRALKFGLKSVASAIPPRPRGRSPIPVYLMAAKQNLHVSFVVFSGRFWVPGRLFLLLWFWLHDIDRGGIQVCLDVRRVVFLDHLDAGAAVLGDLVNIRSFHQAQTDVCMPQAVSGSRSALSIESEILFVQNRLEELVLPLWKEEIGRFRKAIWLGILGDLFGFCETFFLCARPAVLAGEIAGTLPEAAPRPLVDVDLATKDAVLFCHVLRPEISLKGVKVCKPCVRISGVG